MFISQLKDKIVAYDKFGEHRINGLKALFVLELLFFFNFIYTVNNPYFYFFYVPITAFTAELIGNTLEEKYLFLFFTIMGTALSIFLFGVLSVYKTFFAFFVFFYSALLYYIVIHKLKRMLPLVPVILSLAVYSLIYVNSDNNFYIALNHVLQIIVAMLVIFLGLFIFPKTYYLSIWRRAFYQVVVNLETLSKKICEEEVKTIPIFSGIIVMERYSKMLSKKIKYYSIIKITLLAFELIMSISYLASFQKKIKIQYIKIFHHYLIILRNACLKKEKIVLKPQELALFNETHELRVLYRLILSWNYVCADL
ncbi:FUSC family protein [Legionella maioricensis]|uniref:FUSC family protein n=1 Tax=Legionella maioricensis TaxID=2896528 RepID=A0A9X2D243_9GAMM|nr:FUSC family protein [Legionella maioricensis]MCL9684872.1 FUSC family protein [Legionella maioricensis]MCL9688948.1 FUSC family protein [Legionella maioricensis]